MVRHLRSSSVMLMALLVPASAAFAQSPPPGCPDDFACREGYVCERERCELSPHGGWGDCQSTVDCGTGEVCDAGRCVPTLCETTCAEGFACVQEGDVSFCAPRYVDGCDGDAQCGAGFVCDTIKSCEDLWWADMDSFCHPSQSGDPTFCRVVEQACTGAEDCASGWSCQDAPVAGATCYPGLEAYCEPSDPPIARVCVPPLWDEWGEPNSYRRVRQLAAEAAMPPEPGGAFTSDLTGGTQTDGCQAPTAQTSWPGWALLVLVLALVRVRAPSAP